MGQILVELGNHDRLNAIDDKPAITYLTIPTGDGGLTLAPGLDASDFRTHVAAAFLSDGPTRLPDHEALLALCSPSGAWSGHAKRGSTPKWVSATANDDDGNDDPATAAEVVRFARDFWQTDARPSEAVIEEMYWRNVGLKSLPPGVGISAALKPEMLFTNVGRVLWANSLGGGQVGATGAGTAATSTSLTTASTYTTNQWAGYRVYVYSTTGTLIVWGNISSNTNAASASVLTVDRWYSAATPGGSAATTPTTPWGFIIADGGSVSAWFVGVTTTNITPAATDTSLSGEATTNGMGRKIAPFALTSGTSPASYTLTPVFTFTGSGATTFYAIGVFNSMVVGDATDTMMFETSLNASFTVTTSGDQATITETVSGS